VQKKAKPQSNPLGRRQAKAKVIGVAVANQGHPSASMDIEPTSPTDREREVHREMDTLNWNLNNLSSQVDALFEHLDKAGVLAEGVPPAVERELMPETVSPMGARIREVTNRVAAVEDMVAELLERLEV